MREPLDGMPKPLSYPPRTLNAADQNYDKAHQEYLDVFEPVLLLILRLGSHRFTIRIDIDAWKLILNLADTTGYFAHWRLCLLEFELYVLQRADTRSPAADASLRLEKCGMESTKMDDSRDSGVFSLPQGEDQQ